LLQQNFEFENSVLHQYFWGLITILVTKLFRDDGNLKQGILRLSSLRPLSCLYQLEAYASLWTVMWCRKSRNSITSHDVVAATEPHDDDDAAGTISHRLRPFASLSLPLALCLAVVCLSVCLCGMRRSSELQRHPAYSKSRLTADVLLVRRRSMRP